MIDHGETRHAIFLVLYGTGEGQTAKVASRIADSIEHRGHEATTIDIEELPAEFSLIVFVAVIFVTTSGISVCHTV